jgi:dihydrodipicolinate synthase/N-acetylneuraminate lyase
VKKTMSEISIPDLIRDPVARYPSATVACFDPTVGDLPRRLLDESRCVGFLERLAALHVPAVLIAASTGHGHLRTVDELEVWFRCAATASLGNTIKMALLRPEDGDAANARLIRILRDQGYPVVFTRPGNTLPRNASDAEVADDLQFIVTEAAGCGLAVGLYSIPDVSGLALSPEAAARLVEGPGGDRIVAIKVTEADYESSTLRFLEDPRLRHLKIVQGWDPHLARAIEDGPRFDPQARQRCGLTSGPMSLAVFQYLHILEAAEREDWHEVGAAQEAVTVLFRSMQDDPTKFADLQRAKYVMGLGHPLTGEVRPNQAEEILAALEALTRPDDRRRLAQSLDLMGDGPYHTRLKALA